MAELVIGKFRGALCNGYTRSRAGASSLCHQGGGKWMLRYWVTFDERVCVQKWFHYYYRLRAAQIAGRHVGNRK